MVAQCHIRFHFHHETVEPHDIVQSIQMRPSLVTRQSTMSLTLSFSPSLPARTITSAPVPAADADRSISSLVYEARVDRGR